MRLAAWLVFIVAVPAANAHFHMLIPSKDSVKTNQSVTLTYQFGHPFECEMFDAQKPARARVFAPDGKETDLLAQLEKIDLPVRGGKRVAYRVKFTPSHRGDHVFVFESPPVWMNDEKHFLRDIVRVVVHVQTQNGWDVLHTADREFGIVPMTRPYGLRPGTIFQARLLTPGIRVGGQYVEVEHYNPVPPKTLPADELITLSMRADERGVATCTLPDAGWWVICATRSYSPMQAAPKRDRDGKAYPIVERAILWVLVNDVKAK